jgi:hypothetical protein
MTIDQHYVFDFKCGTYDCHCNNQHYKTYVGYYIWCLKLDRLYGVYHAIGPSRCHTTCRDPIIYKLYNKLIDDEVRKVYDKLILIKDILPPDTLQYTILLLMNQKMN